MNLKDSLTIGVALLIFVGMFYARAHNTLLEEPSAVHAVPSDITVYKNEFCGCCAGWAEHLNTNGLAVEVKNVASTASMRDRLGVPQELGSCHTAEIDGYWIEGHVPVDLIQILVSDASEDIRGLAAPGMPMGAPGMEGPNPVQYDIIAYHTDGTTSVYATREGRVPAE